MSPTCKPLLVRQKLNEGIWLGVWLAHFLEPLNAVERLNAHKLAALSGFSLYFLILRSTKHGSESKVRSTFFACWAMFSAFSTANFKANISSLCFGNSASGNESRNQSLHGVVKWCSGPWSWRVLVTWILLDVAGPCKPSDFLYFLWLSGIVFTCVFPMLITAML